MRMSNSKPASGQRLEKARNGQPSLLPSGSQKASCVHKFILLAARGERRNTDKAWIIFNTKACNVRVNKATHTL